jgi:RimJ/RimL family protein N-acetyltransferase
MFARTERLLLRPGWREDAPALFRTIADERIVRNLATAPWPYGLEHAEAFLARERVPRETSLLVFRRTAAAPELIGTIGLAPRPDGGIEIGYWIARRWWNRGYATEAGRAVVAAARHGLRLKRLRADHFIDNPASGRVLEKLGFRPTGTVALRHSLARGGEAPCRLFELELGEEDQAVAMAA